MGVSVGVGIRVGVRVGVAVAAGVEVGINRTATGVLQLKEKIAMKIKERILFLIRALYWINENVSILYKPGKAC